MKQREAKFSPGDRIMVKQSGRHGTIRRQVSGFGTSRQNSAGGHPMYRVDWDSGYDGVIAETHMQHAEQ